MSLIQLKNVRKTFAVKGGHQTALDGVDIDIRRGEIFGIIGPSGSGKSTLIRLINRLETPTEGTVEIDGVPLANLGAKALSKLRHRLGMIFQQFGLLSSKTARQNVAFALELAGQGTPQSRRALADEWLERVGLSLHADKYPAQLSGGQKQRVAIARALINQPDILLCDEATSALDPQSTQGILDLILELNRELGLTVVVVTHEMEVVRQVCDRVAVLEKGKVVETGEVAQVLLTPHSQAAQGLSDALNPPPSDRADLVRLTWSGEDPLSEALSGLEARVRLQSGQISALKSGPFGDVWVAIDGVDRDVAIGRLRTIGVQVRGL
ncbi:MAG: methionine ABC transporter ATP-binding protein [Asticcacaulis sp.]